MISVSYKKLSLSVCLSSDIFVVEIWTPKHEKGARSRTEGWENMQHKTLALSIVRILLHPAPPLASFGIPVTFVVILTIMFFLTIHSVRLITHAVAPRLRVASYSAIVHAAQPYGCKRPPVNRR